MKNYTIQLIGSSIAAGICREITKEFDHSASSEIISSRKSTALAVQACAYGRAV